MLNSVFNESKFLYVENLDLITSNLKNVDTNMFVLTSYNYDFDKDHRKYEGTSYELYFIDNKKDIHQLTYYVLPGNGLTIDSDYRMNINIDDNTIKENSSYLYIESNNLSTINYYSKGIAKGDNLFYHNDILNKDIIKSGSISSEDGIIYLNNGISMDLFEIEDYLNKIDQLAIDIRTLYDIIINEKTTFKIGDYLYISNEGYITNEKNGEPYMVCVISSGILPDGYARFIPIKRMNNYVSFSVNNKQIPVKKSFSSIPIYDNDYLNISSNSSLIGSKYGFIATDRDDWLNNLTGIENPIKHYYVKIPQKPEAILITEYDWFLNYDYINNGELYKLNSLSFVSSTINPDVLLGINQLFITIDITFKNGKTKEYLLNTVYNTTSKRFEQRIVAFPKDSEKYISNYSIITTNNTQTSQEQTQTTSGEKNGINSIDANDGSPTYRDVGGIATTTTTTTGTKTNGTIGGTSNFSTTQTNNSSTAAQNTSNMSTSTNSSSNTTVTNSSVSPSNNYNSGGIVFGAPVISNPDVDIEGGSNSGSNTGGTGGSGTNNNNNNNNNNPNGDNDLNGEDNDGNNHNLNPDNMFNPDEDIFNQTDDNTENSDGNSGNNNFDPNNPNNNDLNTGGISGGNNGGNNGENNNGSALDGGKFNPNIHDISEFSKIDGTDLDVYTQEYGNATKAIIEIDVPSNLFDIDVTYLKLEFFSENPLNNNSISPVCTEYILYSNKSFSKIFTNSDKYFNLNVKYLRIYCFSSYDYDDQYLLGVFTPSSNITVLGNDRTIYMQYIITINASKHYFNIKFNYPISTRYIIGGTNNIRFKKTGVINGITDSLNRIPVEYVFDKSRISYSSSGVTLNSGAIQIYRKDNMNFDFTRCICSVKIYINYGSSTVIYSNDNLEFNINNTKKILNSKPIDTVHAWINIQYIQINSFKYIDDETSTSIDDYSFNNTGNIIN